MIYGAINHVLEEIMYDEKQNGDNRSVGAWIKALLGWLRCPALVKTPTFIALKLEDLPQARGIQFCH